MSMTLKEAMAVVEAETGTDAEAVADISDDMESIARIAKFRQLREAKAAITEAMETMHTGIIADMHKRGADALSMNGKIVARRTEVETPRTDGAAFKAELPAVWAKFQKYTKSVRLTVTKA